MSLENHTLYWQHASTHRQWSWRRAQASPHGCRKPDSAKTKTLNEKLEVGLCDELISYAMHGVKRSTCAPNYSSPQWVKLYSLHCTVGIKLLLIIYTMITMIIYYAKSKHNVSTINIKSNDVGA